MKSKNYSFCLLILMLASCGPMTAPALQTESPTPTGIFSPTTTPTLASTSTPNAHLTIECLEILPAIPSDAKLDGVIALAPDGNRHIYDGFLMDMESHTKIPLHGDKDQVAVDYAVSPDQKWLAYFSPINSERSRLIVLNGKGGVQVDRLVNNQEWFNLVGWVDNEHLLFSRYKLDGDGSYLLHPLPAATYNPFTREQQELSSDFPNIWNLELPSWKGYTFIESVYDPTLSYVVYPNFDHELVLWNVLQKKPVSAIKTNLFYGSAPLWSPDGQSFLTNNSLKTEKSGAGADSEYKTDWQELFKISKMGEASQLTHLTSYYANTEIVNYSWSPNGRYVAFWLSAKPDTYPYLRQGLETEFRIVVLDLISLQSTNYCIPGGPKLTETSSTIAYPPNTPIWSPDSQRLLLHSPIGNSGSSTVLLDITNNYAAEIAEQMLPMGWLVSEP